MRTRPGNPRSVSGSNPYYNSDMSVSAPITLMIYDTLLETMTLLDSGAARNFISKSYAQQFKIPLIESSLAVEAIDGRPLGSEQVNTITQQLTMQIGIFHTELNQFHVLPNSTSSIILGLPWPHTHNPSICWREGQITQ